MSLGSALVLLAAVGLVALDILVASPWTGLPVVLVMAGVTVAVAEQVRQIIASRRGLAGLAGVLWFEGSLLLALLGFLLARVFLVMAMFAGATARQIAAVETYDLVFMGSHGHGRIIELDAWLIEHPRPLKATSSMTPSSSTMRSSSTSSPQRGL